MLAHKKHQEVIEPLLDLGFHRYQLDEILSKRGGYQTANSLKENFSKLHLYFSHTQLADFAKIRQPQWFFENLAKYCSNPTSERLSNQQLVKLLAHTGLCSVLKAFMTKEAHYVVSLLDQNHIDHMINDLLTITNYKIVNKTEPEVHHKVNSCLEKYKNIAIIEYLERTRNVLVMRTEESQTNPVFQPISTANQLGFFPSPTNQPSVQSQNTVPTFATQKQKKDTSQAFSPAISTQAKNQDSTGLLDFGLFSCKPPFTNTDRDIIHVMNIDESDIINKYSQLFETINKL